MANVLRQHVLSEEAARRFAWAAGFMILASCTALVLKALPQFGVAASVGLVSAVAIAWVVVGSQLPKVLRPDRAAAPDHGGM
jgi:predicted RND superfamily exporter protein